MIVAMIEDDAVDSYLERFSCRVRSGGKSQRWRSKSRSNNHVLVVIAQWIVTVVESDESGCWL